MLTENCVLQYSLDLKAGKYNNNSTNILNFSSLQFQLVCPVYYADSYPLCHDFKFYWLCNHLMDFDIMLGFYLIMSLIISDLTCNRNFLSVGQYDVIFHAHGNQ